MNLKHKYIYFYIIILIIFILLAYYKSIFENFENITPNNNQNNKSTIFISIASYRDKQCISTLKDIFINAKYPHNIYIGICQQNNKNNKNEDCTLISECIQDGLCIKNQIKTINIDYHDAKGPAYARYYCSTLYNNETYYLQIDSHINFIKNWDDILINMHTKLPKNSIISTYPLDYKDRNSTGVPYICESLYKTYKHIPEYQSYIQAKTNNPRLTFIIAAGFLFMPQQAVIDVPFDPYLPYLFMGEETLLAARLWTSGYNIYSPNINIVYHDYTRKDEPKVWNDNISFNTNNKDVIKKVSYLLGTETIDNVPKHLLTDISKYSMGNKRTLAEYLNFSNLDLINGLSSKKWCTI